ncbi:hypothetical protein [Enterococcus sp. AZ172]|uniref:hypothetical protein n=1 Tax=unclassified Enterococcus TaxID=2608891 RepID=UPI003F1ED150
MEIAKMKKRPVLTMPSATEFEQLQLLMELEIAMLDPAEEVIVIAGNIKQK